MENLKGKRILVTGAKGFLGRHVCEQLEGCHPERIIAISGSAQFDLRDAAVVHELFRSSNPEIVIHLAAAVGGIGAHRENPGRFFYDNAIMGLHLIEAARQFKVSKFVAIGSICAYPNFSPLPFREDDLWNGYPDETTAPYGLAKKMMIVQGQAYRQQYGLNVINLLPVNLYGPGDHFDLNSGHVVAALIRKVVDAQESGANAIQVWGTGSATREFLFVRDAAKAIVMATACYDKSDPVNLGSGEETSIRDVVELIFEVCGFQGEIQWDATKPDGQARRCLDVSRARLEFGFSAETRLRDGLLETANWYRASNRG